MSPFVVQTFVWLRGGKETSVEELHSSSVSRFEHFAGSFIGSWSETLREKVIIIIYLFLKTVQYNFLILTDKIPVL